MIPSLAMAASREAWLYHDNHPTNPPVCVTKSCTQVAEYEPVARIEQSSSYITIGRTGGTVFTRCGGCMNRDLPVRSSIIEQEDEQKDLESKRTERAVIICIGRYPEPLVFSFDVAKLKDHVPKGDVNTWLRLLREEAEKPQGNPWKWVENMLARTPSYEYQMFHGWGNGTYIETIDTYVIRTITVIPCPPLRQA